jgi:hypothetical protein
MIKTAAYAHKCLIMKKQSLLLTLLAAWLVAGTLDIAGASIFLANGNFKGTLEYIAGAVTTNKPLSGINTWLLGAAIHYGIALCWTVLYFILYKNTILSKWTVFSTAPLYGTLIFFSIRYVFVPLFGTLPSPKPFSNAMLLPFIKNILILSAAFGVPLYFFAKKYYK